MTSIDSINGMTHIEATKLRRARVRTTVTFLQIASSRSGRALLTKETGWFSDDYGWVFSTKLFKCCPIFWFWDCSPIWLLVVQ